jgi:hypothetical protein
MIQQPGQRRPLLPLGLDANGRGRVGADQIVEHIPTRDRFLQQVSNEQLVEQPPGPPWAGASQRGGGVGVHVRAGVQPQPPVEAPLLRGQLPIGHLKGSGNATLPRLEPGQPLLLATQPLDQVLQPPGRVGPEVGCGDPDRQRKTTTQLHDLGHQRG